MKKPSLSKQSIGNFFLHHTEKLILALCLALFGLFLWMGLKTKPFDTHSPSDVVSMTDRANTHVKNPAVWDSIKPFRKGNTDVLGVIENSPRLKADSYKVDTLTGIPAKTLDARKDPVLESPQFPQAQHFTAPLVIAMTERFADEFLNLPPVSAPELGSATRGGPDEYVEEEDEDEDEDFGGRGGRRGSSSRFGAREAEEEEEEEVPPEVDAGSQFGIVNSHTWDGIIPSAHNIGADRNKSVLMDVVCVTAVLDVKKQFQSFGGFAGAIGFYPDRDKPIYQYVEVQRRIKGGKWVDRSKWIQFTLPGLYPPMHSMPKSFHSSAPDTVAPEHYDPVLTGPIPPIAMFDYTQFISHPKLSGKSRGFPGLEEEEAFEGGGVEDIFSPTDELEHGTLPYNPQRPGAQRGGPRPGGPPRGGGYSQGRRGAPGSSTRGGSGTTGDDEFHQTRAGGDFSDYMNALQAKQPEDQYKLVRFFDVDPKLRNNTTYEYRMRVWMADPNNEDLTHEFASYQEEGGGIGSVGRPRGGGDEYEGDAYDGYGEEGNGPRRPPGFGVGTNVLEEDREEVFEWVEIVSKMKDILVRRRLNRATASEPDPRTGRINYTVAELRTKNVKGPDGKMTVEETWEKIPVPAGFDFLRFARPSDWSDSVEINIARDNSQVAVGSVLPPKPVRLKVNGIDVSFPAEEPRSEVVASTWSSKYGTAFPTKQTVSRGELLNFHAVAHIINPINWRVYLTRSKNFKTAQGEDKYKVPIRTHKVVVDAMGGEELPLPRGEKMRHHLASEILIMDTAGNFKISNDLEDRTTFRNLLLQPDEPQAIGQPKRKKKKKRDLGGEYGDEYGGFDPN